MLGAFLLALLAVANSASVQAAPSPTVPEAVAATKPSQACDIKKRYYPEKAKKMRIEGHALLYCRVEPTGRFSDCDVASESPPNFGFGEAALCMTVLMKSKTTDKSGVSIVGTRVPVPVTFNLAD